MRSRLVRSVGTVAFLALAACGGETTTRADGDKGVVGFSYQQSCFFGCPLEQPLLEGTKERIELSDPGDVSGLTVRSSNIAVAEFALTRACYCRREGSSRRITVDESATCDELWTKHCDNSVLVQAHQAGEAWLELNTAEGSLLDRGEVLVRAAKKISFTLARENKLSPEQGVQFALAPNEVADLSVALYDEKGRALLSAQTVPWQSSDGSIVELSAWLLGTGAQVTAGTSISVTGKAQGKASVSVAVPGLAEDHAKANFDVQ